MRGDRIARLAGLLLAVVAATGIVIGPGVLPGTSAGPAQAAAHGRGHWPPSVLFVAPHGQRYAADRSCGSAAFRRIQSAVNAAGVWGTVVVCRGVYAEQVVIAKPLAVIGKSAVIDEARVRPTLRIRVPGLGVQTIFAAVVIASSHVRIAGVKVQHAQGEGILAAGVGHPIRGISIEHNVVVHNDLGGGVPPASTYFQCQAQGEVPGDCGEGVHLLDVAYSRVSGNDISDNSGGILMSDDTGPTHHNLVDHNKVTGNAADCGITIPGHNGHALSATGRRRPAVAGVYDNVIWANVVTRNGLAGEGAGVLFANAGPGTAVYGNLVEYNVIARNSLAGVTFHAHTLRPGQVEDLSGNSVIGNWIWANNLLGDTLDAPASPVVLARTGVLVFSGGTRISVTIARNHVFNNHFGIWLSRPVTAHGLRSNSFRNVAVPVSAHN
jgi:parallel beta-helix repeat protein